MKLQVSVLKSGEVRTHGAYASYYCRDWGVGGSDIEGFGSPI